MRQKNTTLPFDNPFEGGSVGEGRVQDLFTHTKTMVDDLKRDDIKVHLLQRSAYQTPCSVILLSVERGNASHVSVILLEMDSDLKATHDTGRNGEIPLAIGDTWNAEFFEIISEAIPNLISGYVHLAGAMVLSRNIEEVLQTKDASSIQSAIRRMLNEATKVVARATGSEQMSIRHPNPQGITNVQVTFDRPQVMVDDLQHRVPCHGIVNFGLKTSQQVGVYQHFGSKPQAVAPFLVDLLYIGRSNDRDDRRDYRDRNDRSKGYLKPVVAIPPVTMMPGNVMGQSLAALLVYTVATADAVVSAGRHREVLIGQGMNGLMRHLPLIMGIEQTMLGEMNRENVEDTIADLIDTDDVLIAMDIGYLGVSDDVQSILSDTSPKAMEAVIAQLDEMTGNLFSKYYFGESNRVAELVVASTPLLIGTGQYDREIVELRELNYLHFTHMLAKNMGDVATYEAATGFNDHNIDAKYSHLYSLMSNVMTNIHIHGKGLRVVLSPLLASALMDAIRDSRVNFVSNEDENRRFNVRQGNDSLRGQGYRGTMRNSTSNSGRGNMQRRFNVR